MEDCSGVELPVQLCLVGDQLAGDSEFRQTAARLGHPVLTSQTGEEWIKETAVRIVFILPEFAGPHFEKLVEAKKAILGPPAVRDLVINNLPLLVKKVPVYCLGLYGCVIIISAATDTRRT